MEKIKEVKKILERFDRDRKGISVMEATQQICQLFDAECQDRVERILKEVEERLFTYDGDGNLILTSAPLRYRIVTWWQALKKQEGVK